MISEPLQLFVRHQSAGKKTKTVLRGRGNISKRQTGMSFMSHLKARIFNDNDRRPVAARLTLNLPSLHHYVDPIHRFHFVNVISSRNGSEILPISKTVYIHNTNEEAATSR
jgi:hypothetical protein